MELASINTNVKTLLDKQVSTLALTPIATPSNISQFDINQIYFGDEEKNQILSTSFKHRSVLQRINFNSINACFSYSGIN
jgi:hypothetical protein